MTELFSSPAIAARFESKVAKSSATNCWEWLDYKTIYGYGHFSPVAGKTVRAHRFAYELWIGPIPEGLVLDHLCRNRACVNPAHLEPVSVRVNTLRGIGISAQRARQTKCSSGHEFTPENTGTSSTGNRRCRTCERLQKARPWQCEGCEKMLTFGNRAKHLREACPSMISKERR